MLTGLHLPDELPPDVPHKLIHQAYTGWSEVREETSGSPYRIPDRNKLYGTVRLHGQHQLVTFPNTEPFP